MTINPLEDFQVKELIENNFGAKADKNIVSLFIEKAGGNPLYAEQLSMYLLEKNLVENNEGVLSLKTQINELPPDIYSIVGARLDRLPSEIKEITVIASVVGQEFEKYLLDEMKKNAIKGAAEYFDGSAPRSFVDLNISHAIELNINEKVWNTLSASVLAFVHSIYRETIYNMHLKRKVRILHSYLGDILVQFFNEDNSKFSDIAYQYELAEKYDLSISYYKKAFDFSMKKIKLDRALSYGEKIVSLCDMYCSDKPEKRCMSYFDFGVCLMETGDYDKALEYLNKVLTFLYNNKNAGGIDVSKTLKYMGNIYLHKGEYDKAYEFYEKSLKLKEGTEENSDVSEVYSSMGEIYCKKAEYEKAEIYTKKALEIKKIVFGEKNSTVADSLDSLGLIFQNKGNYEAALECYQKSLKMRTELFGEDYYDAAYSYNNLGCFYSETGEYKTSFEYFNKAVKITENFLGEKHPVVASLYNNIGGCCINLGEIIDAQYFLEKSLTIRLTINGENHPDTAICRSNLGHVYYMMENLDLSLNYFDKALKTMEMFYGEKHPFIAVVHANIGKSLEKKGDLEKALECNKKSLEINVNNFGEEHISVAKNYGGIGRVLFRSEDWMESIDCCEKAINIIENNINKAHPLLIEYCRIASECYKNLGKMEESEFFYKKMIGIEELVKKGNNSLKK
ncbi:tetratricopeptide repeat protein [candidate division WOR-3 bacterium]|nr:tetratricopeptide repeat protein [candidate division WOR-3 bacterium]